jgi:signal transduction histidine kinase
VASSRLLVRPETPQTRAFFLEVSVNENTGGRLLRLSDVTERLAARRDQRSFQTMVSHKLRTPLNGLHGSLELLADPGALAAAEIAEFVAMARESAARLVGVVDDILRFAELSKRPAQGAWFALAGLAELVRRVAAGLSLPTVAVSVAAEARAASIPCAPEALEWVLFELLENARKFNPRGTPAVEVGARLEGKEFVLLTMGDDGVTLSPEQLARAGSPFFQGEKYFTGEALGMGLGLASVFALVWQAGGSCRLGNQPAGPGVCVELKWPLAAATMEPIIGGDGLRPLTTQQNRFL